MPPDPAETLRRCAASDAPANLALMHLLLASESEAEAAEALAEARRKARGGDEARLSAVAALWRAQPEAWAKIAAIRACVDHRPARRPAPGDWAASFDKAAAVDADAAGALYCFGAPDLMAATAGEIVAHLRALRLLAPGTIALDLGCGAGRLAAALSPELGAVIGLDISEAMLRAAARRCAGLGNVALLRGSGRDLAPLASCAFDLVCAVDTFPYLVPAGLAETMVAEAARALRPGGALVVLNYDYDRGFAAASMELAALGAACGLDLRRAALGDFALWDAASFLLVRE